MAVLSSVPCPADGCAAHLRVTGTFIDSPGLAEAAVVVNVDEDGRVHLRSHLLVNNPALTEPPPTP